jgi:hypothetical protein
MAFKIEYKRENMKNGLNPGGMHLLSHAIDTPCVGERRFFQ